MLRDPELARDGVQDGLIRAWRDLPTLQDPDRFEAWIHRLVVNACIDLSRRRRSRPVEVELMPGLLVVNESHRGLLLFDPARPDAPVELATDLDIDTPTVRARDRRGPVLGQGPRRVDRGCT